MFVFLCVLRKYSKTEVRIKISRFIMTISNQTSVMKPFIPLLILTVAESDFPMHNGMQSKLFTSIFCMCPGPQFQVCGEGSAQQHGHWIGHGLYAWLPDSDVWRGLCTTAWVLARTQALEHRQDAKLLHPESGRHRQTE